jgi:hypothetical protein
VITKNTAPGGDQGAAGNGWSAGSQISSKTSQWEDKSPYGSALASALATAELGYHVHPVRLQLNVRGKKIPTGLPKGWQLNGLTDPGAIRARFAGIDATGYMVACGPSGLTVVDLDVKGDGEANWVAVGGAAHAAFEVRTWSGGRHLYFRSAGACNTSGRPGGVDIRGIDGGVFGPGSVVLRVDGTVAGEYSMLSGSAARSKLTPEPANLAQIAGATRRGVPLVKGQRAKVSDFFTPSRTYTRSAAAAKCREHIAKIAALSGAEGVGNRMVINTAAYTLGGVIGSGADLMTYEEARAALLGACAKVWNTANEEDEVWIDKGLSEGIAKPLIVVPDSETMASLVAPTAVAGVTAGWTPVDLTAVLSGDRMVVEPELGRRTDSVSMLYRGKEHAVAGEPESGKTWFALMIVGQILRNGGRVVYVDFEDDENTVVGRILDLGVLKHLLGLDTFRYVRPEGPPSSESVAELLWFPSGPADLLIYDGWTEGAALLGQDIMNQDDIAKWRLALVKPALAVGAATLTTDHVVKNVDQRGRYGIGAQHKLAGLTGVMFTMEVVETWGKGSRGVSRVLVTKDRNGGLRPHGVPYKANVTHIGNLVGDASMGVMASVDLWPAQQAQESGTVEPHGPPRQLGRQVADVSALLQQRKAEGLGPLGSNDIVERIKGRANAIRAALSWLVDDKGDVKVTPGPRGARLHSWARCLASDGNSVDFPGKAE